MKKISICIPLLFLSFLLTASKPVDKNLLGDKKWLLKEIRLNDTLVHVSTKAFLQFDMAKNRAGGNGSCNSFGGSFSVANDSISIGQLFATKMYCEAVQQTEDQFFHLLEQTNRYKIDNSTLLLYNGEKVLLILSGIEKAA